MNYSYPNQIEIPPPPHFTASSCNDLVYSKFRVRWESGWAAPRRRGWWRQPWMTSDAKRPAPSWRGSSATAASTMSPRSVSLFARSSYRYMYSVYIFAICKDCWKKWTAAGYKRAGGRLLAHREYNPLCRLAQEKLVQTVGTVCKYTLFSS